MLVTALQVAPGKKEQDMKKTRKTPSSAGKFFEKLNFHSTSTDYRNSQPIFTQGDVGDAIFRVEEGNVKLTVSGGGKAAASLAILRKGDCFGENCLVGESLRRSTATSIKGSTIGRTSKAAMLKRLREDPAFAKTFTTYLLERIYRVEDDLLSQLVNSSEKRLARLLLQLTDSGDGDSRHELSVPIVNQATLAQVVGTTRSRVSQFMNQFREKGMINYNGELRVHKALLTFLLSKN